MYKLSVPILLQNCVRYGTDRYIELFREMGAERVFVAISSYETDESKRRETMEGLKKYIPVFLKDCII